VEQQHRSRRGEQPNQKGLNIRKPRDLATGPARVEGVTNRKHHRQHYQSHPEWTGARAAAPSRQCKQANTCAINSRQPIAGAAACSSVAGSDISANDQQHIAKYALAQLFSLFRRLPARTQSHAVNLHRIDMHSNTRRHNRSGLLI
jgi:hypothetical protein